MKFHDIIKMVWKLFLPLLCMVMITSAAQPSCNEILNIGCQRSDRWMKNLPHTVRMSQVKIPATHDSGTYAVNDFQSYSVDITSDPVMAMIPTLVNVFTAYHLNITNIKSFVAPWVRTQKCSIEDQLNHGIRHFDLRVCFDTDLIFKLCHALNGKSVAEELSSIKQWSDQHPTEIISLDFNHLYGFNSLLIHEAFANMTLSILGEDNIASDLTFNNTYGEFRRANKHFKLFYANPYLAPLLLAEPSSNMITPWPNVQSLDLLKVSLNSSLNARSDFSKGFVSQMVLTPTLYMMINGIVSDPRVLSVADLSLQYKVFTSWLTEFDKDKINIVNTDYYQSSFVKQIIKLNYV
jgi:hypothetical protein